MLWHDYFNTSLGLSITQEDKANEISEVFDANMIDGVTKCLWEGSGCLFFELFILYKKNQSS